METEEKRDIEKDLLSLITDTAHRFTVKKRDFYLYPMTLAKIYASKPIIARLGIKERVMLSNPYVEVCRLAKRNKKHCAELISLYTTPNTKEAFSNTDERRAREQFFQKNLTTEAVALLLMYCLTEEKSAQFESFLKLDVERKRKAKVMEIKAKFGTKNSIPFGGKSIFGTVFVQLKELGYSDEEILFERPYTFLHLMLLDKMDSVYVTDEEAESIPTWAGGTLIMADDTSNNAEIERMLSKRGLKVKK